MAKRASRWGHTFWYVYDPRKKPPDQNQKRFTIRCPTCGTDTDAPIVARFITEENDYISLPGTGMAVHNFFLKCTRCDSAILVMWACGEDYSSKGQSAGALAYPLPVSAFETEVLGGEGVIPSAILEDLRQAELSYWASASYGAGLLLRRACQYICRDKKAEGKDLLAQIDDLAKKAIITPQMAEMAHGIRIIGNELAHPDPQTPFVIEEDEVKVAREFLVQLVRVVYVDPHRIAALKERLAEKGVKGARSRKEGPKSPAGSDPSPESS